MSSDSNLGVKLRTSCTVCLRAEFSTSEASSTSVKMSFRTSSSSQARRVVPNVVDSRVQLEQIAARRSGKKGNFRILDILQIFIILMFYV